MYRPVESATVVGFYAFAKIGTHFAAHDLAYHYFAEEDVGRDARKFAKRFGTAIPVEKKVEEVCKDHHHPNGAVPIVFAFARTIQHLLLNTPLMASDILDDVLTMTDKSETITELRKTQMDYMRQYNEFLVAHYPAEGGQVIGLNPPHALHFASVALEYDGNELTRDEHRVLERYARATDTLKKKPSTIIILSPGKTA